MAIASREPRAAAAFSNMVVWRGVQRRREAARRRYSSRSSDACWGFQRGFGPPSRSARIAWQRARPQVARILEKTLLALCANRAPGGLVGKNNQGRYEELRQFCV